MMKLQYHKGQPCICSSTFCQEGYCSECEIYSAVMSHTETKSREFSAVREEKGYSHESQSVRLAHSHT
jgi:hypothetical protein